MVDISDEIKDEFDYYDKAWRGGRRKVLKFEYNCFVYVNGVLQMNQELNLRESDLIEVQYHFSESGKTNLFYFLFLRIVGEASHLDYMNFLHQAYKMEGLGIDMTYVGTWLD